MPALRYPDIMTLTVDEFAVEYVKLEDAGKIDGVGGSEWCGTAAQWLERRLRDVDDEQARYRLVRDVLDALTDFWCDEFADFRSRQ